MARILVIDDSEQVCEVIKTVLTMAGHDVEVAFDGLDGCDRFYANPHELVITDIVMPGKEGIEIIQEISRDHPKTKIIAISGGGRVGPESYLEASKDFGASRTLEKPMDFSKLVKIVNELLAE